MQQLFKGLFYRITVVWQFKHELHNRFNFAIPPIPPKHYQAIQMHQHPSHSSQDILASYGIISANMSCSFDSLLRSKTIGYTNSLILVGPNLINQLFSREGLGAVSSPSLSATVN